jgi:hypothetical protein
MKEQISSEPLTLTAGDWLAPGSFPAVVWFRVPHKPKGFDASMSIDQCPDDVRQNAVEAPANCIAVVTNEKQTSISGKSPQIPESVIQPSNFAVPWIVTFVLFFFTNTCFQSFFYKRERNETRVPRKINRKSNTHSSMEPGP